MIISTYDADALERGFGIDLGHIDMGPVESMGVGANWGRVAPGVRSDPHQHDETETFVIVAGQGDLVVDGAHTPVGPGTVIQFEPFETHSLANTGQDDLLFATFYWRDAPRAARRAAPEIVRRRFGDRPVFVFSTPPTPNGALHIGHLSGPYLGTDAFVRFQRMNGTQVWHLAATDDFQSYVAECARREDRSPAEVAEHYAAEITQTLALMDIEPDQITHTSRNERYPQALQAFFTALVNSGQVTKRSGPALFDSETGQYLYEPYIHGGCPTCGSPTGGNICEECGEPNFCVDLADPQPATGTAPPRQGEIERYTLSLTDLASDVLAHHHVGKAPARLRELAHRIFRRDRLDVALTHPSSWGVPPVQRDVPGQVIWVWIELAFGFIYGIESLGRKLGTGWLASAPEDDWKIVHFLGYDNTFYHSILGPALYHLASPGWTPDVDYNVNEFYLLDGDKFSTSRGHAIWGKDILGPETVDGIRYYLALTRPETRRTNFTIAEYEAVARDRLAGTWQRWLNDLGERIAQHYDGVVPDAGIWTPEHTAFLGRLGLRLSEMTAHLSPDGFSLNRAAQTLHAIVEDTLAFSAAETATAGLGQWYDEARTAIALELAAARLLASCAAPVMPRFAARLAAALAVPPPVSWPDHVTLVPAGNKPDLAREVFFGPAREPAEPSPLLPWLSGLVREALRLPETEQVADATLVSLGVESLQAIALQYQILERTGADVTVENLLGDATIAQLAASLPADEDPGLSQAREEVGA